MTPPNFCLIHGGMGNILTLRPKTSLLCHLQTDREAAALVPGAGQTPSVVHWEELPRVSHTQFHLPLGLTLQAWNVRLPVNNVECVCVCVYANEVSLNSDSDFFVSEGRPVGLR